MDRKIDEMLSWLILFLLKFTFKSVQNIVFMIFIVRQLLFIYL